MIRWAGETFRLIFASTPVRLELVHGRDATLAFIRKRAALGDGILRPYEGIIAATDGVRLEMRYRSIRNAVYSSPRFQGWFTQSHEGSWIIRGRIALPFRTRLVRGAWLAIVLLLWIGVLASEFAGDRGVPLPAALIVPPLVIFGGLAAMRLQSRDIADDIEAIQLFLTDAAQSGVT